MFANFIYFIIVLLIYATYQPVAETNANLIDTVFYFIGLHLLFIYLCWILFRNLRFRIGKQPFVRLDHGFNTLLTRWKISTMQREYWCVDLPTRLR